jgi:hypothetical protein
LSPTRSPSFRLYSEIVAGIQSVYKRACELDAFDLIVIDEAHMIPPDGEGMYHRHGYLKPDLLIVDDMGMKQLPKRSGEYLFEIIMRRYETRSTMMTSNRPLEDWGKLIGDVPSATAILDRFLHHAEIVTIAGKSYRLRGKSEDASANSSPMAERAEAKPKAAIPPTGSSGEKASKSDGRETKMPPTKP